jgi:hypothetical protein
VTLKKLIGTSLLLALAGGQVVAAGPPLEYAQSCQSCQPGCQSCQQCQHCPDCNGWHPATCSCLEGMPLECPENPLHPARPTPPPCCADGFCYPKPETWGFYKTRWRHWPVEYVAAAPGLPGVGPAGQPGLEPDRYILPTPDEEDRRAPPPTIPKAPPGGATSVRPTPRPGETAPPVDEAPPTAPGEPGGAPSGAAPTDELPPQDSLFGVPFEDAPATTPLTPPPSKEATPAGSPTGDADPPPALPFKTSVAARSQSRPTAVPTATPQRSVKPPAQGDDPPPAFPLARN